MERAFSDFGLRVPSVLLPARGTDYRKWSVIACDQFTSQPEYWDEAERIVAGAPSTLRLIAPEARLSGEGADVDSIRRAMGAYREDVLTREVRAFVLTERRVSTGTRWGLIAEFDLEHYSPDPVSTAPIRATEGTIAERVPPRLRIREAAPLECPHAMILADDPDRTLIEPLRAMRGEFETLYDFELMLGGERIRGYRVDSGAHGILLEALERLRERSFGMLFAVGDGNHSIAAAKAHWERVKPSIPPSEREAHPARFAMAELTNLRDPELRFEPIHRVYDGIESDDFARGFGARLARAGLELKRADGERPPIALHSTGGTAGYEIVGAEGEANALRALQGYTDELAASGGATVDYVHGEAAARAQAEKGALAAILRPIGKDGLFRAIRERGALPKKAFSMGEATDKRYYLECRAL